MWKESCGFREQLCAPMETTFGFNFSGLPYFSARCFLELNTTKQRGRRDWWGWGEGLVSVEATRVDVLSLTWSRLAQRRLVGRQCRSGLRAKRGVKEEGWGWGWGWGCKKKIKKSTTPEQGRIMFYCWSLNFFLKVLIKFILILHLHKNGQFDSVFFKMHQGIFR